jgi:DNA-binding XRE family transcriptional regulator
MLTCIGISNIDLSQRSLSAAGRFFIFRKPFGTGTLLERKEHEAISCHSDQVFEGTEMIRLQDADCDFLQDLGRRVCAARTLRKLSRRTLALTSGISERYIAQLEAGKGNISVLLLRRLSRALIVPLTDIIPSGAPYREFARSPQMRGRCIKDNRSVPASPGHTIDNLAQTVGAVRGTTDAG